MMDYPQSLMRYPHTNNSLLSSGNTKKSTTYEPRTEAISPAINDDIISAEDSTSKSTKDEQTLLVDKLKKVEAEILQTDLQIVRLRRQKEQLEQAANSHNRDEDDQENVCDTKQLSIAKLVYHENRAKALKSHSKLECTGGSTKDLPIYNQPSDNNIYHQISSKYNHIFKPNLITCFKTRLENRLNLEDSISKEYDRRMEKWLKCIEAEDSQPSKRIKDAKTREFFEKQFPELKKARESGERFSRVGQRVARSDAEVAELLDGITEREDQDKKVKSYAVIPPMLEEMRSTKPKYINKNGYVDDIIAEYKEYQILNTWTDEEKEIFRENYLQHPKDFGLIARMTSRKNVANCVQYYYLSKKSENYKQLLKRQQKRRTRSFVRPAQATPAHPISTEAEPSKASSPNSNDKQAGDSVALDATKAAEPDGSKLGASLDQDNDGTNDQAQTIELTVDNSCCICSCRFSDTNTYRNVTRSNHQLYGIGRDALKPGMKICYSCRFRHVKHPNFDDPYTSPEPMDEDPENLHLSDIMDVDKPVIEENPKPFSGIQTNNNESNIPASRAISSPKEQQQSELIPIPNLGDQNKGPKRTCVRDIIYQAIEMSFQKPKSTEPMDVQPKQEPIHSDAVIPPSLPILPPHNLPPPTNMLPLKQIGPNHAIPNSLPPPPYMPMQNLTLDQQDQIRLHKQYMEYNYRQQLQAQHMQHQRHIRHQKPQQLHQQPPQSLPPSQLPSPMMARYSNQPLPTNSLTQPPLRHLHQTSQPNHPMSSMPTPNHNLLTTTVPISSPSIAPAVSHQPSQKPLPPSGATNAAHPIDFSRKYNEPAYALGLTKAQNAKNRPPPMAHSGKSAQSSRGSSVDEGVLNLSAKTQSPPAAKIQPLKREMTSPPKSPPRPEECDESRSPQFANSPTSPSEMVIDESADVGSPSSASSPASDRDGEKSVK